MHAIQDIAIGAGLTLALIGAFEVGFRAGRRAVAEHDTRAATQIGAIQGAVLGLLGLLLAFSFSAAGSRFLERQDLIVAEANAIGTAFLRADLLDEPHRGTLRSALRDYTAKRIELAARLRTGLDPGLLADTERLHAVMWSAAIDGVRETPDRYLAVLDPVNEVIDLHSIRLAAGRKHLPMLVFGLLVACCLLAVGVIGYGCGLGGRRRAPLSLSLILLISSALWITIDLDHPRAGLLQLSDAPLEALRFDTPRR